jgi:signal transduction histidine kinase
MNRWTSLPLRVILPGLFLGCSAAAGLGAWQLSTHLISSQIEAQFLDESRLRITGLQSTLEYLFRKNDLSGVRIEVSGMATRPDVIAAFVVDERNRIVASTRYATIGDSADAIARDLPEDLKSANAARVEGPGDSLPGNIVLAQDRRVAVAYFPLLVSTDDHALRAVRRGSLVLVSDMQAAKSRALAAAGRQAVNFAVLFGGLAALGWGFIHFNLTRRVARLLHTTRQLAGGDLSARTGLGGSDELGQVAGGIDAMAIRIADDIGRRKRVEEELVVASRSAGMAEIATNVLHNVGNVLNSVNVSATLVQERLEASKVSGLAAAVAMMRERESDLGAYLQTDPRGKLMVGYLGQLSEHLMDEQTASAKELGFLRENLEHIKRIVAMQQSYARGRGIEESIDVVQLVEDSLRNVVTQRREELAVVREFDQVPPVRLDKHKVLQVLLNLLQNAVQSCDASGRTDKRLTVRVLRGDGRVRIAVVDNGAGILRDNLTRIFNHGFTTKQDGHGFGLHGAALSAQQMGGSLWAHSDGAGAGATFTLELPLQGAELSHA